MLVQLLLILLPLVAFLYFKFVYVSLPAEIQDKGALHFMMLMNKVFVLLPFRLLDYFDAPAHYKVTYLKFAVKFLGLLHKLKCGFNVVQAPNAPNVGHYDTSYNGVTVRVYIPAPEIKSKNLNGSIVYMHGGGWMVGSLDQFDPLLCRMVQLMGMPAVSIDYSLSPTARFPVCVDECEKAVIYHLQHGAAALHVDPSLTVLMGDSAGGNLTAVIVQRLVKRRRDGLDVPMLKANVPFYPVIQCADLCLPCYQHEKATTIGLLPTDVMHLFHLEYFGIPASKGTFEKLSQNQHLGDVVKQHPAFQWLNKKHLPEEWQKTEVKSSLKPTGKLDRDLASKMNKFITDPDYSPIFAKDFSGIPPTMIVTCGYDVLRDEGALYAKRLESEGVDTTWKHYPETFHGIIALPTPTSDKILKDVFEFVKKNLE